MASTNNKFKTAGIVILVMLVLIQFYRPARNVSNNNAHAIGTQYPMPDSVSAILKTSCYDCHSNYTVYPWYANVQPVYAWLTHHIEEGNQHLNFSEFASYRIGRQYHMLGEISKVLKEGEMPISSYTLIHTYAKLSAQQSALLTRWADSTAATIKATYPADSLKFAPKRRRS